jgi:hypothetical protein
MKMTGCGIGHGFVSPRRANPLQGGCIVEGLELDSLRIPAHSDVSSIGDHEGYRIIRLEAPTERSEKLLIHLVEQVNVVDDEDGGVRFFCEPFAGSDDVLEGGDRFIELGGGRQHRAYGSWCNVRRLEDLTAQLSLPLDLLQKPASSDAFWTADVNDGGVGLVREHAGDAIADFADLLVSTDEASDFGQGKGAGGGFDTAGFQHLVDTGGSIVGLRSGEMVGELLQVGGQVGDL